MLKKLTAVTLFFIILIVALPYCFCLIFKFPENTDILSDSEASSGISASDIAAINSVDSYITETDTVENIDFEEYITGVVAAEMPAAFCDEALKAQAVAARSYIISKIQNGQTHENGAIVCNDPTHCKAYSTKEVLKEKWGDEYDKYYGKIEKCVSDTKDCVMIYNDEVINAVFHSTSSGKTENASDVWGQPTPYLISVASFGDELSPKFTSSVSMSIEEFKQSLKAAYPELEWQAGDMLIGEAKRSEAGSIISISIGNIILSGSELRQIFSLYSANINFDITDTTVTMNVLGNGHGVGMSQYGANYLASQGKSFIEILKSYYTGIEVVRLNR